VKEGAPAKTAKRGRPAKAKDTKAEKAVPKVVTPKAEKEEDEEELQPSWDAPDEDEEEKEEKKFEIPEFTTKVYKDVEYLLELEDNEMFTADGDMKWIGTWTGKKVVKGEMSERVKKILASQE
jgi:hypothetical protein